VTKWQAVALGVAGAAVCAGLFWPPCWERMRRGDNDFLAFYTSGRLAGGGRLYDTALFQQAEVQEIGSARPELLATRPPFFAMLFRPLARLSYGTAYLVWLGLLGAATVGFVLLWPDRQAAALACCWSGGLAACFTNTQDLPLILLWLALALRLREKHPFLAGLALALCAAKFHVFVFLPLLVWRHRLWRGFVAGAAALVALSFAAGWDWPRQYWAVLAHAPVHPRTAIMPNLHGLLAGAPHGAAWEALASAAIAGAVWMVVRRTDFAWGLAAVLTGGLLVSYHAYLQDCAVLLPALLIAHTRARYLTLWLFAPLSALCLLAGHPAADVTRLAIAAFFGVVVWQPLQAMRRWPEADAYPAGLEMRL
jgi:Glycosyltransferase family 87